MTVGATREITRAAASVTLDAAAPQASTPGSTARDRLQLRNRANGASTYTTAERVLTPSGTSYTYVIGLGSAARRQLYLDVQGLIDGRTTTDFARADVFVNNLKVFQF